MALKKSSIRILKIEDFSFSGEIDNYESLVIIPRYRGISELRMTMNLNKNHALDLQKGRIIFVQGEPDKNFQIQFLNRTIANNTVTINIIAYGFTKKPKQRVTVPPAGQTHESYTSQTVEYIVKQYIDSHMINPVDTDRTIPYFSVAPNQSRGSIISDKTRFKNLYEELVRLLTLDNLGMKTTLDFDNNKVEFDVYEGSDRTQGNTEGNPPIVFSLSYDNLETGQFVESIASNQTFAYVGGEGEGLARNIQTYGTDTGDDRFEFFQDARDTNDNNELINRGKSAIIDTTINLSATINPLGPKVYDEDYFVGDLVTIVVPIFGVELNARITEAQESYEGNKFSLRLTFGDKEISFLNNILTNKTNIAQSGTI